MSVPTSVGFGTQQSVTGAATVAWPAAAVTGDYGILVVETANQDVSLTTANGFEALTSLIGQGTPGAAGAVGLKLFGCRATSDAPASPVVADAGDHMIVGIMAFRLVYPTATPVIVGWDNTYTGTDPILPGGVTLVDDALVVGIIGHAVDAAGERVAGYTNADLASITQIDEGSGSSGVGGGYAAFYGTKLSKGAFGTSTATVTGGTASASIVLVLNSLVLPSDVGSKFGRGFN